MALRSLVLSFVVSSFLLASSALASVEGTVSGLATASGRGNVELTVRLKNLSGAEVIENRVQAGQEYEFFPVKLGDYELTVCAGDVCSTPQSVHVASGSDIHENLALEPPSASKDLVVQVKAKKKLVQNISTGTQFELNQSEVRQLPQGSEAGLPKLISSTTAGVVPGAFGQLFFRGNHASIQYQLDGIQMPESPSSSFGQSFSPRNIDRMEVITGGIPAEYGQRLSAVVNVVTKAGPEKPEGEVELNYGSYNTFSPHLLYGGSNEKGDLHYYVGLNFNRTDRGIDTPNPESLDNQKQGGTDSVHNRSEGNGEFAKLDWQMNNADRLSLILFHAYSFYQIPNYPTSFDPKAPNSPYVDFFSSNTSFTDGFGNSPEAHHGHSHPIYIYAPANDTQTERNAYAQVVWKHTIDSRSYFQFAPYYKYSSIVNTADPSNDLYELISPAISGANPVSFAQNRHANSLGLKGDYSYRLRDDHLIKTGFQLLRTEVAGFYSIQTNPAADPKTNSDPMSGTYESLYLQDDFTLFREPGKIANHLVLNAGIRFDATQFAYSGINPTDYQFQPRVGLNYMLDESTRFHVFYGRLFQPAPIENLRASFKGETGVNVPYDIKAEKADFYELGVSRQVFGLQVASMNVFYKNGINFLDDAQLLRTPIAQPFNFAQGYVYGAELGLKGQINGDWSNYLNYSYLIARAKGISGGIWASDHGSSDDYQNMDHSQMHTANAGLTYAKKGFWWTTQALFGSGLWTGENNSSQLPSHLTFDTTVGYEFTEQQTGFGKWRVSMDLLNVLNNRYPITIANSFNGSHYAAGRQIFLRVAKAF